MLDDLEELIAREERLSQRREQDLTALYANDSLTARQSEPANPAIARPVRCL